MAGSALVKLLDSLSSKRSIKYTVYLGSIVFFFSLILLPPILGILLKWNTIGEIFEDPNLLSAAMNAIYASFSIAIFVSVVDLIAGLPMAWYIARGKSKWLNVLDTLADIPFVIPTATLGYSLLLFWSDPKQGISSLFGGSLISPGWLLVILLHFAFSYPVIVRVMVGALLDYKQEYEAAARTLGAPPLTADRTVTFPILKFSLISSFTLAFARSISETGATMMVAGAFESGKWIGFENGPIFIWTHSDRHGPLVFVSLILIAFSCLIFAAIRLLGPRLKMPVKKVWPATEKRLSSSHIASTRNSITLLIFFALVFIPSLFVALPAINAVFTGTLTDALRGVNPWGDYWQSLLLSYFIGTVVTLLNVIVGLPMAVLIARRRLGTTLSAIFDILVDIPMIVPSIALGFSLRIFWKESLTFIPEIWLLIFAHLSITYPYFVRSMSAAIKRISVDLEEASRTLGARPLGVLRTIVLPLTKYSLLSGAIMMFTRSVNETGATKVVTQLKTAPVLLVSWVDQLKSGKLSSLEVGLACGFLVLLSFVVLLILRLIARKGR
ncbi:MAG: ABC transporter permease subunit [Thermoproteota archaeon]|nr:ABC transporter permease subunit [Thermoproteota archaeon]